MPTYDYRCRACDHEFEHFQSMTSKVLRKCPECGKLQLQRLIGAGAGLLFKGSGFYITDYRSDSYKSGRKKDGESGGGSADKKGTSDSGTGSSSSSADKKPAAENKPASRKKKAG